jgi:hypothetical protein
MSETHVPVALRRLVRERADECCEYCRVPESATWSVHTLDHIIAEKHGGQTGAENLALACTFCNMRKGSDLASIDDQTGLVQPLFHPRRDRWSDHFSLVGGRIDPLTPSGRATARLLRFNDPDRVEERQLLVAAGLIREPNGQAS